MNKYGGKGGRDEQFGTVQANQHTRAVSREINKEQFRTRLGATDLTSTKQWDNAGEDFPLAMRGVQGVCVAREQHPHFRVPAIKKSQR